MSQYISIPKYLDHTRSFKLYSEIQSNKSSQLRISMKICRWAEHSELQRLAVYIVDQAKKYKEIVLILPNRLKTTHQVRDSNSIKNIYEVIEYANRIHFFSFLHKYLDKKLVLECDDEKKTFPDEKSVYQYIQEQYPLSGYRDTNRHPYFPIHSVEAKPSIDNLSNLFTTGERIENLLEYYTDLDFVKSGEFSTLIVHELLQNIIEHAWPGNSNSKCAAISLVTVELGDPHDPEGRYQQRLGYSPSYEKQFIKQLKIPGYLELCVSDNGIGIPSSLAKCEKMWKEWFPNETEIPTMDSLFAAAFWAYVTRDAGPHRPGKRGLFYVYECLREYGGVISCLCVGGNKKDTKDGRGGSVRE